MSPETAQDLKAGDVVALRNKPFPLQLKYIAQVTRDTKKAFWLAFGVNPEKPIRIAYTNIDALRDLRIASPEEKKAHQRANT